MHTYYSTELTDSGYHRARHVFRRIIWLLLISLFLGPLLPGFFSIPTYSTSAQRRPPSRPRPTANEIAAPPDKPEYDCAGDLEIKSEVGRKYIEQAIAEALDILRRKCKTCSQMFDRDDPDYAIQWLEKLRRNKAIIISERIPTNWKTGSELKKLKVLKFKPFMSPEEGAEVKDLGRAASGEMLRPCIYVNSKGFMATGLPAEDFALYGLDPPVQRAIGLLHELGHVAGILQVEGEEGDKNEALRSRKSVDNTNCVRLRCDDCEPSLPCDGAPERKKKSGRSRPRP